MREAQRAYFRCEAGAAKTTLLLAAREAEQALVGALVGVFWWRGKR